MPYATVAQVAAEFRTLEISSSTAVKTAEVDEWIEETSALIDAYVGARYVLPIVALPAIAILRMICRQTVACRVKKALEVKGIEIKEMEQGTLGSCDAESLMELLEKIKSGKLLLPDAVVAASSLTMASGNVDNSVELFFKTETDQW